MSWLIALLAFLAFLFILPHLLKKFNGSKSGAAGAIALAFGMAFSSFLEPAKKTALENIEKKKETGELEREDEQDNVRTGNKT